ncbi:SAM-dependent methyltransferase [Candidatus Rhabdochlamydia sp. T3358]|uniref:SAM-dependent methyltransferase n=1 Tax=Candidatus Rhabdochlamydia sp. T3358 TaxID=2099795 RepID=UPI0010B6D9CE|nr:SAM-dependent methyltransferase [Candidatus Rhabdochlamydia sp. T3358]VHO02846.1 Ribosomal RNA small subunit methyltransferase I [Candidatus Rhabdochlamydia sp. T3358]
MPTLYLLPNLLDNSQDHHAFFPSTVDTIVANLGGLIAETEKEARRYLKRFVFLAPKTFRDVPILLLNEHTTALQKEELVETIAKSPAPWGLISDCGLACLADPGADIVLQAKKKGIQIEACVGPSSIVLALMLSGLGGQRFIFHGYLPREEKLLMEKLKQMTTSSQKEYTHLFIETPYRNQKLFKQLCTTLPNQSWLSIACNLTSDQQWVKTDRIAQWKKEQPLFDKLPAVFVVRND